MDLRVLLTTFGIIFLAEMGDKTQLAAMTMAALIRRSRGPCFLGPVSRLRQCRGWGFWWGV